VTVVVEVLTAQPSPGRLTGAFTLLVGTQGSQPLLARCRGLRAALACESFACFLKPSLCLDTHPCAPEREATFSWSCFLDLDGGDRAHKTTEESRCGGR